MLFHSFVLAAAMLLIGVVPSPATIESRASLSLLVDGDTWPVDLQGAEGKYLDPDSRFTVEWSVAADDRAVSRRQRRGGFQAIILNLIVQNNLSSTQTFSIRLAEPVFQPILSPAVRGLVKANVIDLNGDGAALSAPVNQSMYIAFIDDVEEVARFADPTAIFANPFNVAYLGPVEFGKPGPIAASQPANTDIAVLLQFDLSGSDIAQMQGQFEVLGPPHRITHFPGMLKNAIGAPTQETSWGVVKELFR